jgi:hypothetical protein
MVPNDGGMRSYMNPERFDRAVERGLNAGDWTVLEDLMTDQCTFTYNYGADADDPRFDSSVFNRIIELLGRPDFLSSTRSSNVLRILEYDWSTLTRTQKGRLLPRLVSAYPHLADDLSLFLVAELLGEYYGNRPAFEALKTLARNSDPPRRSLVAMGLGRLASIKGSALAKAALAELASLSNDQAPEVRSEAESALAKLRSTH